MELDSEHPFEHFRGYLHVLAENGIERALRPKLDASDVVQETLLKAYESRDQVRGQSVPELAAWLRTILANHLANVRRDYRVAKRDIRRERSLEEALNHSSARLVAFAATAQPSPSNKASQAEVMLRVADALASIPNPQREAIVLHHFDGLKLSEVAERLGRTPDAVSGLLRRGLRSLHEELAKPRGAV